MRKLLASVALVAALVAGAVGVSATPAQADACGDTEASWVPNLTGSAWLLEIYIGTDMTGEAVFAPVGQLAATVNSDTLEVFTGNWDYEGGSTFAWSATEVGDSSNRLTFRVDADDCGPLGYVNSAYGIIIHQTMGQIGTVYMGLLAE